TPVRARKFMQSLCDELGLDRRFALPAYEDAEYYVRREGQLPKNVKANHSKLADPLERERLRRVFDQGLDAVSGHVLPLEWVGSDRKGRWRSSRWQFRRDRLYLLPGDSPLGLRLPLSSLPWEVERDYDFERDPFRELPELDPPELGEDAAGPGRKGRRSKTSKGRFIEQLVHTALCVELRRGHVHVFMPPLKSAETWLGLLATV